MIDGSAGFGTSEGLRSVAGVGETGTGLSFAGAGSITCPIEPASFINGAGVISLGAASDGAEEDSITVPLVIGTESQQAAELVTVELHSGAQVGATAALTSQHTGSDTTQGVGAGQQVSTVPHSLLFRFRNRSRPRPAQAGLNVSKTVNVATVVQRTQNRKLFDMEPSPPVSRARSKSEK